MREPGNGTAAREHLIIHVRRDDQDRARKELGWIGEPVLSWI